MEVFVLKIETEVYGVFKSIDSLYELLESFVSEDFNWDELKEDNKTSYNFGLGFEEEVVVYKFIVE